MRAVLEALPVRSANLGTGENGLHPDFIPIVETLHAAGVKVSLTSNGYSVSVMPDVLVKGFHEVEFSSTTPPRRARTDSGARGRGTWACDPSTTAASWAWR